MLEKLKDNYKMTLTGAGFILLVMCYYLALRPTFEAWRLNHRLKLQINREGIADNQPGYLQRKKANTSQLVQRYHLDTLNFRSHLLDNISLLAEKNEVRLTGIPPVLAGTGDTTILIKVDAEGDYFQLLRFANEVERSEGNGFLRSVNFKLYEDHSGMNKKLLLSLWLAGLR